MKILYEGTDIYNDVSVNACFHDMHAEKRSDELMLRLNDTRGLWDEWNPQPGDEITVEDGIATTGKMFIESALPENGLITLRAYSIPPTAKDKTNKSWEKVRFLQIAQEIAGRHGLGFEQYSITDQMYEYVAQNNQADFQFLQQRCTLEGASFLVFDGKLVLYGEAAMEGEAPAMSIDVSSAMDFTYQDDATRAYGSAEVVNGKITGTFDAPNGPDKKLSKVLSLPMKDQAEANRFAKNLLRNANKGMVTGVIWTKLQREVAAGSVINVTTHNEHSWDGAAYLYHVRHDYVKKESKLFYRKPLEGY